MAKKAKAKAIARVPQSREEAVALLVEYGTAQREIDLISTVMNEALAKAKEDAVTKAMPFAKVSEEIALGLQVFCEANRAVLTNNNATKTIDFGTGSVSWRVQPASVTLRGVDEIIKAIQDGGESLAPFLRTTVEVDKVAMLRNPNLARTITGVTVASAGEAFTIEPFGDESLPEAAQ